MTGTEKQIEKLFAGEVVPIDNIDITYKPDGKVDKEYVPIIKRTVGYIAMAIVFDDEGRVLLIQEAKPRIRGQWYIPAGRVEPGENLVDGVRREVLEEAGIEIDPITLCCIEMFGSLTWYRMVYTARATGGKLKTLEEQDEESLQAQWFTINDIMLGSLNLRGKDFFKSMLLARDYMAAEENQRHPSYQIGIQPHEHLLLRPVIIKPHKDDSVEILSKKGDSGLPVIQINTRDKGLSSTLTYLYKEVFGMEKVCHELLMTTQGLITLEHCGIPAREHDGLCVTAVFLVTENIRDQLCEIKNPNYTWTAIQDKSVLELLGDRIIKQNRLIPCRPGHI